MRSDERFEITAIARDGQPIEPIRTKDAFAAQCGVLVRDKIPISIHQWYKPKKEGPEVSYVNDMQKRQIGDIGFINTNLIDAYTVEKHPKEAEANLLQSLVLNQNKDIILFPYNFK